MNVRADVPTVDLNTVKTRQQGAWSSGDYAMVGTTLQIVGEMLCEAVDLRSGQRVLDVAAGNGNATLAAARRFAEVVSTDYVGALLERGRERAAASVALPLPAATSSTCWPLRRSTASHSISPTICKVVPMIA